MEHNLDARVNAYRPDLADIKLQDIVDAEHYVEGELGVVDVPAITVRAKPDITELAITEIIYGEEIYIFEQKNGWAWVQGLKDKYVGYVPINTVKVGFRKISHIVSHARTFLFDAPDIKTIPSTILSMGTRLDIFDETQVGDLRFLITRDQLNKFILKFS